MENLISLRKTKSVVMSLDEFTQTESIEMDRHARPLSAGYILGLLNFTGVCLTHAATRSRGATNWSKPFTIQRTCQNCSSGSHAQCVIDKKYTLLYSVNCTDPSFDMFIGYLKDPATLAGGTFEGITPDCAFAGVILDYE